MKSKSVLIILLSIAILVWIVTLIVPFVDGRGGAEVPPTLEFLPKNLSEDISESEQVESLCEVNREQWRSPREIEGLNINESMRCNPDNPWAVAAFVKGTNNVSMRTLMETRLASDAVLKGNDKDGDGDPDEIHITLEVAELNGSSPDGDFVLPSYSIAPGIQPGLWVFAPKTRGMAMINVFSTQAIGDLRAPSPVIRVEQGDTIKITLENTHYLPHTVHLHGVDHPYLDPTGKGNDGVPVVDSPPVLPGESKTYWIKPRQTGTMFYHCHVQTDKHLMMGLQGMFVVEENRPNNWLQTFNVGAGYVRHPSVAVKEAYDQEYDLHYQSIDKELSTIVQRFNDPRLIAREMNRVYDMTDATSDYFLLNGHSFPYTLRDSMIVVKPDEKIKLRIVNGKDEVLSLHTHGHKATITHYDGVQQPLANQITRDVYTLSPAQRIDLQLSTANDGLHSYSPGVWLFHNHAEKGISTDGRGPGGDISMIVYRSFLKEDGMPLLQGSEITRFLNPDFYAGKIPVWGQSREPKLLGEVAPMVVGVLPTIALGLIMGLLVGLSIWLIRMVWNGRSR